MYKENSFERPRSTAPRAGRPATGSGDAQRHPLLRLIRPILTTARRLLAMQRERMRIRRDEELLRQMSRDQLRDIGLERLSDGHFAPIAREPWLEEPPRIPRQAAGRRPELWQGRNQNAARR